MTSIALQSTIKKLQSLGCPPLPVAPKQDPRKPNCHQQAWIKVRFQGETAQQPEIQGDYCRISITKVGDFQAPVKGDYCRLDENLNPIERFTGKNPTYIDRNGFPRTVKHRAYQDRMPTESELKEWFANPINGVGTLGGHNGVVWLDFDAKNYPCQEDCDRDVERTLEQVGKTWVERTGSGGWRIAVRPKQKPTFTNFTTDPSGEGHIGEALWAGRFTVLAPTIHPNGNAYVRLGAGIPAIVESLQAIGIYPTKDELSNQQSKAKREATGRLAVASNPQDNPWDIRNFAEYLEGSHQDGEYAKGRCPVHSGVSDNSLHIHIPTGGFKCWAGCSNKEIYQKAKEVAISSGYAPSQKGKGFAVLRGGNLDPEQSERDRYIQKRRLLFLSYWEDLKKDFTLSPTGKRKINYYKGYAPTLELSAKSILLRGWLGAGKTEATLRSLLRSLSAHKEKQIVWGTGRNGLLRQIAQRAEAMGFTVYHYQDDPGLYRRMLRTGQPGIFMMCPDSLKEYAVGGADWSKTLVVIDEFSGVRREILEKAAIMPEFERLVTDCLTLIAVDAFLGDIDARIISQYRPGSPAIHDQEFTKSQKKITWLETRNKDGDISFSHDGICYPLLKKWVADGETITIATDSKLLGKACNNFLQNLGYIGVLCSSETIEGNCVLMPDPDRVLTDGEMQFIVYTPTAQSGLDVQFHFTKGLALYSGIISPADFLQMIGRCRQCDEWFVSAPRRSIAPACPVPSLGSKQVWAWKEKLGTTFDDLEVQHSSITKGWGVWQSLTGDIEKAFHSEYLEYLLKHFFETVETLEVATDRPLWISEVERIKKDELHQTLTANLANGQRLQREQKAPSKDSEAWDVLLAIEHEKYPDIWKGLISDYGDGTLPTSDEALTIARIFTSKRLDKLKNWVSVTGVNAIADIADLYQRIKQRFTAYNSPNWKALQYKSLFRALDLGKLGKARKGKGTTKVHKTHYRIDSPVVGELWAQFQRLPKLQRLFPTVENIQNFWAIVKRCMSFFGYQGSHKNIRVATPGQRHPNGRDKNGVAVTSESVVHHFSGWLAMEESGSALFQTWFPTIVQSISDLLERERVRRLEAIERHKERQQPPPLVA